MALLTLAEARTHITTALVDAALQRLLDAAEDAITDAVGPVGAVTEVMNAGPGRLLMLSRHASAITSISEDTGTPIGLNANDYAITGSGRMVTRLYTGANPSYWWRGRVTVVYTAVSDVNRRKVAQLALVQLDIDFNPATASERIGDWTETYKTDASYIEQRDEILAGLTSTFVLI